MTSDSLPVTGLVKVRVLQVNTLTQGELVHDLRVRVLPRAQAQRPLQVRIRDEICPRPPRVGDRLRLTMQMGQVAGVQALKSRRRPENEASDEGDPPTQRRRP